MAFRHLLPMLFFNVWRFPYLADKHGIKTFIIAYIAMVFAIGIPIFYLELAICQRFRRNVARVLSEVSPYFVGIGVASAVTSIVIAITYSTVIAWSFIYLLQSTQTPLPWESEFKNSSYCDVSKKWIRLFFTFEIENYDLRVHHHRNITA